MATFHNSSAQFLRLRGVQILASSNFSELSDSRVKIQIHLSLFETVLRECLTFMAFTANVDLVVDCS